MQTILNLDIFSSSDKEKIRNGVFDRFSRTFTDGGYGKLKSLFNNGHPNNSSILETQESLKYILKNYDTWSLFEDLACDTEFEHISSYLNINITVFNTDNFLLPNLRAFIWKNTSRGYFQRLQAGTEKVFEYLYLLNNFLSCITKTDLPVKLASLIGELVAFAESREIMELLSISKKRYISPLLSMNSDRTIRTALAKSILNTFNSLYELDCLFSMALAVYDNQLSFPAFIKRETPLIEIEGLYHPLVDSCVKNDFTLNDNSNLLFLTGPNMAGKSTYIKAVAVSVYLAHLGFGVPAEKMKLTEFDCLIASMTTADDITSGYSYFYNEVRRVREIGESLLSDSFQLVILDEPFKGTNIQDAFDANKRLINLLIKRNSALFLFSTHIIELMDSIKKDSITCKFFKATEENTSFTYDYLLKPGISNQKLGVKIMEQENVFDLFE